MNQATRTGMKFAIDAHAIGQKLTGNEVYVRNLLACFAEEDSDSEFLAYISTPDAVSAIPARFRTQAVSTNPFFRLGVEIPFSLLRERPDLLHVQYTSPLVCPVPIVVSVHDVSFLEYPNYFSKARASQLKYTVKRTVHAAARILTPSAFSRKSVAKAYNLDPDRISVIHNGVSPQFRPVPQETAAAWLMRATLTDGIPVHGESDATRASPLSMTAVTPSIVMELSATFVEKMIFGCGARRTAWSCSSGERSPCKATLITSFRLQASMARRISAAPGRKTSVS